MSEADRSFKEQLEKDKYAKGQFAKQTSPIQHEHLDKGSVKISFSLDPYLVEILGRLYPKNTASVAAKKVLTKALLEKQT